MQFKYNFEKNAQLLKTRGIGFEEIIKYIESGEELIVIEHPNKSKYPNQKIFYVKVIDEVCAAPFLEEEDGSFFLKTLFPSRKARKYFLNK